MNINEYIEKYTTIEKLKDEVIVTMKVPPRKVANIRSDVNEESKKRKVRSSDISNFLENKGYKNLTCLTNSFTIDNSHPRGLEKTWVFKVNQPSRKKTKIKSLKEV